MPIKTSSAKVKTRIKGLYKQAISGEDYLNQRLDKTGNCWLWLKGKDRDGYGQCSDSKYARIYKVTRAHQLAYRVWKGEKPEKSIICHTCDNPSCCNPEHLYAGTWESNVRDCIERGRYRNGSKRKADYMEVLKVKGIMTSFEASKIFNISFSRVCQIWRGEYSVNFK